MPRYNRKPDFGRQVQRLSRQVASQGTAARNQATSITAGATTIRAEDGQTPVLQFGVIADGDARGMDIAEDGVVWLRAGGQIVAFDDELRPVVVMGALIGIGKPQNGFTLSADYDGEKYVAFALADYGTDDGPVRTVLAQYDHRGNNVVATDIGSDKGGLASPHLGGGSGMKNADISTWPKTTETAWTTIEHMQYQFQNPCLQWDVEYVIGATSTAQLRLLVGGVQVGDVHPVPAGGFGYWGQFNVPLPAAAEIGQLGYIELQARVTSGTESVAAQTLFFQGDQSASGSG